MKKFILIFLSLNIIAVCFANAQDLVSTGTKKTIILPPEKVDLKPGNGLDKVQINCLVCHSSDYIKMQPPFTRAQWIAETSKMMKVFGAKITDDDAKIIPDYLAKNYGAGK